MSHLATASSGYVRMPREWVALDVSPGAKVMLLHLCSAANQAGESWYKFRQLQLIVHRSKAAISGYIRELKELGLIETEHQRTANGYQAHLLIRIVGWSDITRRWSEAARCAASRRRSESSGRPAPRHHSVRTVDPTPATTDSGSAEIADVTSTSSAFSSLERCVQPAERKHPSGDNKSHDTNTSGKTAAARASKGDRTARCGRAFKGDLKTPAKIRPEESAEVPIRHLGAGALDTATPESQDWSDEDEALWRRARPCDTDPVGVFDEKPTDALLRKAVAAGEASRSAAGLLNPKKRQAIARDILERFMGRRRLAPPLEGLDAAIEALASRLASGPSFAAFEAQLETNWLPHWRRLSTPAQLQEMADRTLDETPDLRAALRRAGAMMRRGFIARMELRDREALDARLAASAARLGQLTAAPGSRQTRLPDRPKAPHIWSRKSPNMLDLREPFANSARRAQRTPMGGGTEEQSP